MRKHASWHALYFFAPRLVQCRKCTRTHSHYTPTRATGVAQKFELNAFLFKNALLASIHRYTSQRLTSKLCVRVCWLFVEESFQVRRSFKYKPLASARWVSRTTNAGIESPRDAFHEKQSASLLLSSQFDINFGYKHEGESVVRSRTSCFLVY